MRATVSHWEIAIVAVGQVSRPAHPRTPHPPRYIQPPVATGARAGHLTPACDRETLRTSSGQRGSTAVPFLRPLAARETDGRRAKHRNWSAAIHRASDDETAWCWCQPRNPDRLSKREPRPTSHLRRRRSRCRPGSNGRWSLHCSTPLPCARLREKAGHRSRKAPIRSTGRRRNVHRREFRRALGERCPQERVRLPITTVARALQIPEVNLGPWIQHII